MSPRNNRRFGLLSDDHNLAVVAKKKGRKMTGKRDNSEMVEIDQISKGELIKLLIQQAKNQGRNQLSEELNQTEERLTKRIDEAVFQIVDDAKKVRLEEQAKKRRKLVVGLVVLVLALGGALLKVASNVS